MINLNIKRSEFWLGLSGIISLVGLALTPIHTKLSGVAWVSFVLFALIFSVKYRSHKRNISSSDLFAAIKWFIVISVIALLIRWMPQIVVGEFNEASTFNIRVLVIALLAFFLCQRLDNTNVTVAFFNHLPFSLLFIGLSALAITLPFGENTKFGTHPIPWAAAISMLTVVLHIVMLNQLSKTHQLTRFILLGWLTSIAVLIAILVTGKRGSYFYLIWLISYGMYSFYVFNHRQLSIPKILLSLIVISLSFVAFYFLANDLFHNILHRIILGYQEVVLYFDDPIAAADTSVGARLYMWHHALMSLDGHWMFGLGIDGTEAMIKSFADQSGATMLIGLNQLHNEYLQALVSYGILGLLSFLLYPFGLLIVAFKLYKTHPSAFVGLLGIVFLFLTSSLTNTNTYHNYFGTVFSLAMGLVFIVCRLEEINSSKPSIKQG